jgi:hypothetical protein
MAKSRHQSLYDFMECLQLEYITVELRSKIYPSASDKKYYRKVMGYKMEKIQDIALRNDLPTIFNSEEKKREIYEKTYSKFGVPAFAYKDQEDKDKFIEQDLLNYFAVGSEVRVCKGDNAIEIAVIADNDKLVESWENLTFNELETVPIVIKKRKENTDSIALISQISRIL